MDTFDDYEVVSVGEGSTAFEFRHKGGTVFLTTTAVNLSTLIKILLEDEVV